MQTATYKGRTVYVICRSTKNSRVSYTQSKVNSFLAPTPELSFMEVQVYADLNRVLEKPKLEPLHKFLERTTLPAPTVTPTEKPTLATVRARALEMMTRHGLTAKGWRFAFDPARKRAGVCKYGPKIISLSQYFATMNTWEEIDDTILHEIAHALAPGAGHGPAWKAVCVQIGAKPVRCYDLAKVVMPLGRFQTSCGCCKKTYSRDSDPRNRKGWFCRPCGRSKGLLTWADTHR